MPAPVTNTNLILNPDGSIYHLNLKPEHISDVIIAVGDPGRVHLVSQYLDKVDFEMNKREFITHVGSYKGKRITVISSGMGTNNVEILLMELDALVNIDLKTRRPKEKKKKLKIIRIGTSASIQEDIRLGSHVISEYAIGLDPLMAFYNLNQTKAEVQFTNEIRTALALPFQPYVVEGSKKLLSHFSETGKLGNTVTCPGFFAPQGRILRTDIRYPDLIKKMNYFHFNDQWLTNLEMETAGYYALSRILGHEAISLNAIVANRIREKFSKIPNQVTGALIKKVFDKIASL